jgi:alpha-glucosidase
MRTPMQWSSAEGAGFTDAGAIPWLPFGDHHSRNVDDQRRDPASVMSFTRELIALRRRLADLRSGAYAELDAPPRVWAWQRGESVVVALNLSDQEARVQGVEGTIAASTPSDRRGEAVAGVLPVGAWAGVVVENASP